MPFPRSLIHQENTSREQLLKINHEHGSRPKEFTKDSDISGSGTPKSTFKHHQPKVNPVHFNFPYEFINTRDNTNGPTPLVNETDENIIEESEAEE